MPKCQFFGQAIEKRTTSKGSLGEYASGGRLASGVDERPLLTSRHLGQLPPSGILANLNKTDRRGVGASNSRATCPAVVGAERPFHVQLRLCVPQFEPPSPSPCRRHAQMQPKSELGVPRQWQRRLNFGLKPRQNPALLLITP